MKRVMASRSRLHISIALCVCLAGCGRYGFSGSEQAPDAGDAAIPDAGDAATPDTGDAADLPSVSDLRDQWSHSLLLGSFTPSPALDTLLSSPRSVSLGPNGTVYLADTENHRIRKLDLATNLIETVAGIGIEGSFGDQRDATRAHLHSPYHVTLDAQENLFIVDRRNHSIRKVDALSGVLSTVVGTLSLGSGGDGGPASEAGLYSPSGMTVDGQGNIFIADTTNHRIRKVDAASGIIETYAGTGTRGYDGDDGDAGNAALSYPTGVEVDASGNVFIVDGGNHCIRRVDSSSKVITTVAGDGNIGSTGDDGPATNARLSFPSAMALDASGNVFIADRSNHRIRRVDVNTQVITTVAGDGSAGSTGDDGDARIAQLWYPTDIDVDDAGNLFIADEYNHKIRRVDAGTRIITAIAGAGYSGLLPEGSAAQKMQLRSPQDVAFDSQGNSLIVDTDNHRVRQVDASTGTMTTVVGSGVGGFGGDDGDALAAQLFAPAGIAVDANDNIFVSDTGNNRVRRVDAITGIITTVAGNGSGSFSGDNVAATQTPIFRPQGIDVDRSGNLFIADRLNSRIRRVDANTQLITTVAGVSTAGFSGDDGLAVQAELEVPSDVVVDIDGNLFIADRGNSRIRHVSFATGIIHTLAGTGTRGLSGDGGPADQADLHLPIGLALGPQNQLFISDEFNSRIRSVDLSTEIIRTLAGTSRGFWGDGALSVNARFNFPAGIAVDGNNNLLVADESNDLVRRINNATSTISTLAGRLYAPGNGPALSATLADVRALVLGSMAHFFAGGVTGTVLQKPNTQPVRVIAGRYQHFFRSSDLARFQSETFGSIEGIALDESRGYLYLTETDGHRIHKVTMTDPTNSDLWRIEVLAGSGVAGFTDELGEAAQFDHPTGLHLDTASQILYVADAQNHVIRAIDLGNSRVTTTLGVAQVSGATSDGSITGTQLSTPNAMTLCADQLYVADTGNHRILRIHAGAVATVFESDEGPVDLACDASNTLFIASPSKLHRLSSDGADGAGAAELIYQDAASCISALALVNEANLQFVDSCAGALLELVRQ